MTTFELVHQYFRAPKGFEKFFKHHKNLKEVSKKTSKEISKEAKPSLSSTNSTQNRESSNSKKFSSNDKKDFVFDFFSGKKIDNKGPSKEIINSIYLAIFGTATLFGMKLFLDNGKEVTWREFVYR
jgi:hypothetical protein